MSCFRPNLMECRFDSDTGSLFYLFDGPAKMTNPLEYGSIDDLSTKGSYKFIVPCGKCLGCRIDYSREWANRMIIELQDNPNAMFVTLTYRNADLPRTDEGVPTLVKRDIQLFLKRLRKHFSDRRIRFYIAGEYGPKTLRPHYHGILYGLSLADFSDLRQFGYNDLKDPYFTSPTFEKIWSNGFVMMSCVTHKTCAYVARYVLKKQSAQGIQTYSDGRLQEFSLCSRKPGIGLLHAEDYVLSGNTSFAIDGRDGVHDISLPKTFIKSLKSRGLHLDKVNDICYNRSRDARSRLISNLLFTEKTFYDFLSSKEANLTNKLKLLPERMD